MDKSRDNVRFLIPRPITPVIKPPMYRSVFTESVKKVFDSNRDCHRTMGYAEVKLEPPSQFLKKHTRKVIRPIVENVKCDKKSPGLPKQSGPSATKPPENILQTNIIEATRRIPPPPKHRVQDTRDGHVILLQEAGLEPYYVRKKNYGKTPAYIVKMHNEKEAALLIEEERKRAIKPPLRLLLQEERERLLTGLKTNWLELHTEFLLLPVLTDTGSKIKRKTSMEKELASLEKDIDMLERNKDIYVCQDEE